ncbi:MAG: nuclear transport factor 2 family protein [Methylococcales bacterium]
MSTSIHERIRVEIEDLHEFFCNWFAGKLPKADFDSKFTARFAPDLVFIPPAGELLGLADLSSVIYDGYASNPKFRIQIREVTVRQEFDSYVLATYEEWQHDALASKPPDNGRVATVVFKIDNPLKWVHIHETWLPKTVMASDKYDF